MDEVAGTHDLGAINRGEEVEITSSLKALFSHALLLLLYDSIAKISCSSLEKFISLAHFSAQIPI